MMVAKTTPLYEPASAKRRRLLFPVAWMVSNLLCTMLVWRYLNINTPPLSISLVILFIGPLCLGLWLSYIWKRPFDILDPINVVGGVLALGFWGNLLMWPGLGTMSFAAEDKALLVTGLSTFAFLLGYRVQRTQLWARRLPVPRLFLQPVRDNSTAWLMVLWAFTIVFRVEFLVNRGYGSAVLFPESQSPFDNLILLIGNLGPYLLYMTIILALYRRSSHHRFLMGVILVSLVVEVGLSTVAGWKSALIVMGIALLLGIRSYFTFTKARKVVVMSTIIVVILLPLFLFTFLGIDAYRQKVSRQGVDLDVLVYSFREVIARGFEVDLDRFYQRLAYGSMLSNVVGAVDSGIVDFQRGRTLWPAFVWFVPRALWPGKPVASIGGWYATTVLGWSPGGGEAAVTLPGDFYLNFGIPGVLVGMFLYGLVLRIPYEYLVVRIGSPIGVWAFLPIILGLGLGLERNLAAISGQALQTFLFVLVVIWFLQRRGLLVAAART
ncbi:MAG: hypothetical protein ACUVRI_12660 [Armatimonadota bacterium]